MLEAGTVQFLLPFCDNIGVILIKLYTLSISSSKMQIDTVAE
jgi:hypothetical protein